MWDLKNLVLVRGDGARWSESLNQQLSLCRERSGVKHMVCIQNAPGAIHGWPARKFSSGK